MCSVVSDSLWPMDCRLPGSSVYGIFQTRILEWVAISYSKGSSQPRDRTPTSCTACAGRRILYHCAKVEAVFKKKKGVQRLEHKTDLNFKIPLQLTTLSNSLPCLTPQAELGFEKQRLIFLFLLGSGTGLISQFYNQDFPHGRWPVPFSWVTLYDFSREQRTWSCATGGSFADLTHLPLRLSCCHRPPVFYFYCKSSWNHCLYLSLLLPSMCFQDNPSKPSFPLHFSYTIFSKKLIEDFCKFSHLSFPPVLVTAWSAFSRNLFSLVFFSFTWTCNKCLTESGWCAWWQLISS